MKCFLVCVILAVAARTDAGVARGGENINRKSDGRISANDKGVARNCGDAKYAVTVEWQPATITLNKNYTVDFSFTPAENWKSGFLTYEMRWGPVIMTTVVDTPVTCAAFQWSSKCACPMKKGVPVKGTFAGLLGYQLTSGQYSVMLNITDDHHRLLIYVDMTANVVASGGLSDQFKDLP